MSLFFKDRISFFIIIPSDLMLDISLNSISNFSSSNFFDKVTIRPLVFSKIIFLHVRVRIPFFNLSSEQILSLLLYVKKSSDSNAEIDHRLRVQVLGDVEVCGGGVGSQLGG